jgi:hypothetical protein
MKHINKFMNFLLMTEFKNKKFNNVYRWKIYNFLLQLTDKDSNLNIKKFIKENTFILKIFLIFISVLTSGILIGIVSSEYKINNLKDHNNQMGVVIQHFYDLNNITNDSLYTIHQQYDSVKKYLESREWKEYIIKKESDIDIPKNLPDSVFFFMENQRYKQNIPNSIFWRLIYKESTFRMVENVNSGAYGYMQVMPSTFEYLKEKVGVCQHNWKGNITVGTYLLRKNYDKFKNKGFDDKKSWELALSTYNAGIKPVVEAGYNIPEYKETINYVSFCLKKFDEV